MEAHVDGVDLLQGPVAVEAVVDAGERGSPH